MKNVNMSKLFAAIIQRRDYIECEVDIKLVELVYKWTNNFIHSSFNTFPWLIQFSHDLLAPIFKHTKYDGHFDLLAGIRMHPSILVAIRDDILKPYLSDNPGAYIYGTREADCYVGFLKGSVP